MHNKRLLFPSGPMKIRPGEDVLLGLLPLYHIYGLVIVLFGCIAKGAKLIMLPKFEPKTFLESIQKYEVRAYHQPATSLKIDVRSPS